MSQENVEIVRRLYADLRGLTAASKEIVAIEAEFDFTAVYLDKPILRSVDEACDFRDRGPWGGSPIRFERERFFDVDDERVLVYVRVTGTGRQSGVSVELRPAHECTICDGLLVRIKVYGDRAEALEANGLSEKRYGRPAVATIHATGRRRRSTIRGWYRDMFWACLSST